MRTSNKREQYRKLAKYYYDNRHRYPKNHWKLYYNDYRSLGGKLLITEL